MKRIFQEKKQNRFKLITVQDDDDIEIKDTNYKKKQKVEEKSADKSAKKSKVEERSADKSAKKKKKEEDSDDDDMDKMEMEYMK